MRVALRAICPICEKEFKIHKHGKKPLQRFCSKECQQKGIHPRGYLSYFAKKQNMTEKEFMQLINKEHNENMLPLAKIAEKYGIVRITLMRWCKDYGIKTRTISEDNARRYKTMSQEQKSAQVKAAHAKVNSLMQNKEWKNNHMRNIAKAQHFGVSKAEVLLCSMLVDYGYIGVQQYQIESRFIDIAFPEIKLAIEIDGNYWHSQDKIKKRDLEKEQILKNNGWELLRFSSESVLKNPDYYLWEVIQNYEILKNELDVLFCPMAEYKGVMEAYTKSKNAKKTLCVTTGQVFESAGKAAEYYGLKGTSVCAAARNNKTYGTYNGERLAWRYI